MTDTIDQLLAEYTDTLLSGDEETMTADTGAHQELSQLQDVVRRMVSHRKELESGGADQRIRASMEREWAATFTAKDMQWRSKSARRTRWVFSVAMTVVVIAVLAIPYLQGGENGGPGPGSAPEIDPTLAGWLFGFAAVTGLVYYLYNRTRNR